MYFWTSVPLPTKSGPKFLKVSQKRHNFIDTPSDKCFCNQGIEDTNHLFLCPFFAKRRATNVIATD